MNFDIVLQFQITVCVKEDISLMNKNISVLVPLVQSDEPQKWPLLPDCDPFYPTLHDLFNHKITHKDVVCVCVPYNRRLSNRKIQDYVYGKREYRGTWQIQNIICNVTIRHMKCDIHISLIRYWDICAYISTNGSKNKLTDKSVFTTDNSKTPWPVAC